MDTKKHQLFLGFDLSTQGLKALVFDFDTFKLMAQEKIVYS